MILVGAMALAETSDSVKDALSILDVERLTVVALVIILFDGGSTSASAGLPVLAPIPLSACSARSRPRAHRGRGHYVLGLDWIFAGLVGAAIAPTDPAVTFSVFGSREIRGRAGTILEGEAG